MVYVVLLVFVAALVTSDNGHSWLNGDISIEKSYIIPNDAAMPFKFDLMTRTGEYYLMRGGTCDSQDTSLELFRFEFGDNLLVSVNLTSDFPLKAIDSVHYCRNDIDKWLLFLSSCSGLTLYAYGIETEQWLQSGYNGLSGFNFQDSTIFQNVLVAAYTNNGDLIIKGFDLTDFGVSDQISDASTFYRSNVAQVSLNGLSFVNSDSELYGMGCTSSTLSSICPRFGLWDLSFIDNNLVTDPLITDVPFRTFKPEGLMLNDNKTLLILGGVISAYPREVFSPDIFLIDLETSKTRLFHQPLTYDFAANSQDRISSIFRHEDKVFVRRSNSTWTILYELKFEFHHDEDDSSTLYNQKSLTVRSIISNTDGRNLNGQDSQFNNPLLSPPFISLYGIAALIFGGIAVLFFSFARKNRGEKLKKVDSLHKPISLERSYMSETNSIASMSLNRMVSTDMSHMTNSTMPTLGRTLAIPGFLMMMQGADFVIENKIAEGSSCEVFKCRVKSTLEEGVVKVVKIRPDADMDDMKAIFFQEVATMYLFHDSKYILKLLGYSPQPLGLITKYCEKGSLSDLTHGVTNQWVSMEWDAIVLSVALEIATAINEIHSTGIVHNDIKPDNILFDPTKEKPYHIVLCDFGVASIVEESLKRVKEMKISRLVGASLVYAAPEVLKMLFDPSQDEQYYRSDPATLKAADIYAYGITLYETLARKRPYARLDTHELIEKVQQGTRPLLPPEVIKRCQKDDRVKKLVKIINSSWSHLSEMRMSLDAVIAILNN